MKRTRKTKTSAKEGQEKRDRKIISTFFSMLEDEGLTLEDFNDPRKKKKRGIAMNIYETIAGKMGISEFTVLRVLQRNGYVPRRRYALMEETPAIAMPPTVTP